MKNNVLITIRGTQTSPTNEQEVIELTTDATLKQVGNEYELSYSESDLTGLSGTITTFSITQNRIILKRSGTVESKMEFIEGQSTDSLYQIDEGALLIHISTKKIQIHLCEDSGWIDLCYAIEIENTPSGIIDYHITVNPI